jgi:hypothetical protein
MLRWVLPLLLCASLTGAALAQKKESPRLRLAIAQSDVIDSCGREESRLNHGILKDNDGAFSRRELLEFMLATNKICGATIEEVSRTTTLAEVHAARVRMKKRFTAMIDGLIDKDTKEKAAEEAAPKKW